MKFLKAVNQPKSRLQLFESHPEPQTVTELSANSVTDLSANSVTDLSANSVTDLSANGVTDLSAAQTTTETSARSSVPHCDEAISQVIK